MVEHSIGKGDYKAAEKDLNTILELDQGNGYALRTLKKLKRKMKEKKE